ncbi:MAG: integrase family protein [Pseudolabrys sp.]|jgi:integrase
MPKKRLTEEGVARLKPPAAGKQSDYFDAGMPGLVLRVNYGGAKVWRALYYLKRVDRDGKRVTVPTTRKLGRYPHLRLKEAREAARRFLADPQRALSQADAGSFREVAENFIKRHVEPSHLRTQPEIERCLKKYIYPIWEHRPFRELKRGDVATLLDRIVDDHGPRQADVCLAIIRKMMNWYASRNDDYVSPVVRGMHRTNGGDRKGKRILSDDEIRALWKAADDCGTFGALLKVLLLTAQRREKVATMKWDDLVDGEWRIPSEPREKSNAGNLRLPQVVLGVVEAQPRMATNPHVFAAGHGNGAFNSFSQRKEELDEKLHKKLPRMTSWVIHDLRRTARSLMSRAGVRPDISERIMGHAIPGIEGVYDRHSYSEEKADGLNRLASLVGQIINPPPKAKVSQLDEHRRKKRRAKQ